MEQHSSPAQANVVLQICQASLQLGGHSLFSELSLNLSKGEMVGVSGESGSGKTSLLRAVLGFVPLDAGSVKVCGLSLDEHHVDEIRRMMAYVPQELQPPAQTVDELVGFTHSLRANRGSLSIETTTADDRRAALTDTFHDLGLADDVWQTAVPKLSGGQRQRILIAAALTLEKPLLLLDEPTSALDADTSALVATAVRRACQGRGMAALIVSHDASLLRSCDRIVPIG